VNNNYSNFWNFPTTYKCIMTKKELLEFRNENTMNGEFRLFARGECYDIKSKSLGLGQYQVWLEESDLGPPKKNWRDNMLTETQAQNEARKLFRDKP
jgi:hypothetical protein